MADAMRNSEEDFDASYLSKISEEASPRPQTGYARSTRSYAPSAKSRPMVRPEGREEGVRVEGVGWGLAKSGAQ